MSLESDFNYISRFAEREFRIPAGDFLPTTPPRLQRDLGQPAHDGEFQPGYRIPDCTAALSPFLRNPLAGLFGDFLGLGFSS